MQAPPGSQRPPRRRPTAQDTPQAPSAATNPMSSTSTSQPRTSSGSGRMHSGRSVNPDKQISQIEKSVTHLLVATKQLLETLTQWSRNQAQEEEVSDVYVRLGYEFNLACRAFNSIGVDTSDLGPVPDLLRSILEDTLSQTASPQALDNYLPRIRDIIINLLHGLKRKQSKLRSRHPKESSPSKPALPGRQGSGASAGSAETGLTHMLEDLPNQASSVRSDSRQDSLKTVDEHTYVITNSGGPAGDRNPSIKRQSLRRDVNRGGMSDSPSMSSSTAQNMPVLPPYADQEPSSSTMQSPFPPPPPPPPKQDALTALQREGDLGRRASRRFSAYQIQKHLGASPSGIPVIPPAQNSPIPNRGREVRESMTAVRSRTSYQQPSRTKSKNGTTEISPSRPGTTKAPQRISEEREDLPSLQIQPGPPEISPPADDSPTAKTPDEFHRPSAAEAKSPGSPFLGATSGPLGPVPTEPLSLQEDFGPPPPQHQRSVSPVKQELATPITSETKSRSNVTPPQSQLLELQDSSPPQGNDLTLFLQYKSKVKKFVLSEGYNELTIARLQLAFIEKFAWNTHNNGVDLPEIYIQDPVSGIRHELEDLSDVKDRSVLVLNVEVLDEVKKHFDDGIGGLRKTMESMRSLLDGQGTMMQRFSDRQLETSKEVARMSAVPPSRPIPPVAQYTAGTLAAGQSSANLSLEEIQRLRRDIAVLRQKYANMSADFATAMTDIKAKAANVKAIAADAAVPNYEGNAGRAHINSGKQTLSDDSESLVTNVDDISDRVEDLRKDVVLRGVRPLPRQLDDLNKDISMAVKDLARMKDYIKREKPIWTKIWEQELNLVCVERDELTSHEELVADLQVDLEQVAKVAKLVEETTKQQNMQNGPGQAGLRSTSRNLPFDTDVDPQIAKDGVLGEVRALQPNHENRLEAIERAEKLRQKELESRKGGVFQREVEKFVEEGKLKKTGGADEVERLRKIKDERARKENWERMQSRQAGTEARTTAEAQPAASVPTIEVSDTNGMEEQKNPSNHNSLEGEPAFEDASEVKMPSAAHTPNPDEQERRLADGPPTLPEVKFTSDDKPGTSL